MSTPTPTRPDEPYILRDSLHRRGLHFDFLRLRCGAETDFRDAIEAMDCGGGERPRTFIALSEWDAVVILPCDELYPKALTSLYGTYEIASAIAGTAGYFAYMWDHRVNDNVEDKLNLYQRSGIAVLTSLRFEEWVRRDLGLGAEMLFCDFIHDLIAGSDVSAIVAHTLGWNDVVVILHAPAGEHRLIEHLSAIRLATGEQLLKRAPDVLEATRRAPVFAASYSHLIGSYDRFLRGELSFGSLVESVEEATLLVRVAAAVEAEVRVKIQAETGNVVDPGKMPSEMGHYSFSADITPLAKTAGLSDALCAIRNHIGKASRAHGSSYAETSTVLRFREPDQPPRDLTIAPADPSVAATVADVKQLMTDLPRLLEGRGVSPMTVHRFSAVLTTLIDHLSDPVRSSVVRHLIRFLIQTAKMLPELERQEIEDLCHICEYAMTQATDGIVQFQHDANSLGLSGRGGYSRLILAIETYVQDLFDALAVEKDILITFGLRTGHIGVTARFQIDVPFNVLFAPIRWYILLHEIGHIAWTETFGWMPETLAVFEHLEKEITWVRRTPTADERQLAARVEFIRTRELIRELFPNFLVYLIACGGSLAEFNRLSLRHILSRTRPGRGTRELLVATVLHCMLDMAQGRREWWKTWSDTNFDDAAIERYLQSAIDGVGLALATAEMDAPPRVRETIPNRKVILFSPPFRDAVKEALSSVTRVLSFVGKEFARELSAAKMPDLAGADAAVLQTSIEAMIGFQKDTASWRDEGFARWLTEGQVLAVAPAAHVWSRLLLESHDDLRGSTKKSAFMVSQLAVLLSIWHRAVTAPDGDARTRKILHDVLVPLQLATRKTFSSPNVA